MKHTIWAFIWHSAEIYNPSYMGGQLKQKLHEISSSWEWWCVPDILPLCEKHKLEDFCSLGLGIK
jgi:hypothetical protein